MAGNVQEKQLRWYNIALMSFITVWGFGNVVNNYANQAGGCFFMGVYLCALFHTLCANCWSVRFDLQRWEGRGQYWIKHDGTRTGLPRRVDLLGGAYSYLAQKPGQY